MKEKVALITGSTRGIGKAIALMMANMGFKIIINGASTNKLSGDYKSELEDIYGELFEEFFLFIQADISKAEDRSKIVKKIKDKYNRIDVLVNNAGIAPPIRKDILEASVESFEKLIKINLQGPYFLTRDIANWMITLKDEILNYQPYIVNISSVSSFASSPDRGEYCISKAGITMMTKLYAHRLAEFDIPVFEIQPGIIKTGMTEPVQEKYTNLIKEGITPLKQWGLPKDVAKAVKAIVSGLMPYSTGDIIHIDGGFHLKRF
ncbi:MAG: 3-ketoacyl-ACP reductase [Promethearchaeota archaeon]|nr:MAG: 3-ketoacyl-ACP reductase [Candidatus Lokiarchaeota archaeon]